MSDMRAHRLRHTEADIANRRFLTAIKLHKDPEHMPLLLNKNSFRSINTGASSYLINSIKGLRYCLKPVAL